MLQYEKPLTLPSLRLTTLSALTTIKWLYSHSCAWIHVCHTLQDRNKTKNSGTGNTTNPASGLVRGVLSPDWLASLRGDGDRQTPQKSSQDFKITHVSVHSTSFVHFLFQESMSYMVEEMSMPSSAATAPLAKLVTWLITWERGDEVSVNALRLDCHELFCYKRWSRAIKMTL